MYYLASDQADCRERCRQEGLGTMGGTLGSRKKPFLWRGEESRLGSNAILGRSSESGLRLNFRFGDPTQIIPFAFG